MKVLLRITAAVLVFFGIVWFLQGVNILPGSFMTGQMKWAVIGGIAFVAGILLFVVSGKINRKI